MAEYESLIQNLRSIDEYDTGYAKLIYDAAHAIEELSKERKTGKNVAIEYDDCDQFVCSECGIELQDWHRVERDEDDGDVTYHEYRFRFCPNCGMKINGGDDDV